MALILYRVTLQRLQRAGCDLPPEPALADLCRIQHHTVRSINGPPTQGVSTIAPRQADGLDAVYARNPSHDAQMARL